MNNTNKVKRTISKAKKGQIYVKVDDNVKFIDFGKMEIENGLTLEQFIEQYTKKHNDLLDHYLSLAQLLKDAQFVYPNRPYQVVGLKDGYICQGNDYVVELTVDIEELYKGYCIIENHKVIIDERKKALYLKTFEGGIL